MGSGFPTETVEDRAAPLRGRVRKSRRELEHEVARLQRELERLRAETPRSSAPWLGDLAASDEMLDTLLDILPVGIVIAKAPTGEIVRGNRRAEEIFQHPVLHSPDAESYDEWIAFHADGRRVESHEYPLYRVLRDGEDMPVLEAQFQRHDGSRVWLQVVGSPIRDVGGRLTGAMVAVLDIDAYKRLEAEQAMLARELNHRVKNLFAVVTSIITLSGKADSGANAVRNAHDRVMALARAHEVSLGQTRAVQAPLRPLVQSVVQPYQSLENNRIRIDGPDVLVPAAQVTALGLLLHELATNAIKHGALSDAEGAVGVSWRIEPRRAPCETGAAARRNHLIFEWQEESGRPSGAPAKMGFGIRLMRQAALQLEAELEQEWSARGLILRLDMPL